jgi:hypothetical protein
MYLDEIEKEAGSGLVDLNFRDKRRGWLNNSVVGTTTSRRQLVLKGSQNSFYNAFIVGTFLRSSCYQCPVNGLPRLGNLTIADFWGIQADAGISQIEIDKGISLMLVNGPDEEESLLTRLTHCLVLIKKDFAIAKDGNAPMCEAAHEPVNRTEFFMDLDVLPYSALAKKHLKPSLKRRLDQMIKENFSAGIISKARSLQKILGL